MKTLFDKENAQIDALRSATGYAKVKSCIKWLKEENLPIWWDLLYQALQSGNLQDMYCERWAEKNYLKWDDVKVKNELRSKFNGLSNAFNKYQFPTKWVKVAEDQSFDIDLEAINEHFKEVHTYTIKDEQEKAVKKIVEGMKELDILPRVIEGFFKVIDGNIEPDWRAIGKLNK